MILRELGVERGLLRVESVAFGAFDFLGGYVDRLVPNFDLHVGVGLEVVVPVWMGVGSSFRGEDYITVAVLEVHHRVDPGLAGAGTGVIDKE